MALVSRREVGTVGEKRNDWTWGRLIVVLLCPVAGALLATVWAYADDWGLITGLVSRGEVERLLTTLAMEFWAARLGAMLGAIASLVLLVIFVIVPPTGGRPVALRPGILPALLAPVICAGGGAVLGGVAAWLWTVLPLHGVFASLETTLYYLQWTLIFAWMGATAGVIVGLVFAVIFLATGRFV